MPRAAVRRPAAAPGGLFAAVYALAAQIPRGKVATYGQLARLVGRGCTGRIAGFAMASAPPKRDLPCHRVVNQKGEMAPGPVFGGADRQRRLLKREGVSFHRDGRINFQRSRHVFPDQA